jgi:hypothetical protein
MAGSRQGSQAKPIYALMRTNMSISPNLNIEFSIDSIRADP